jgi:hypothetical protein
MRHDDQVILAGSALVGQEVAAKVHCLAKVLRGEAARDGAAVDVLLKMVSICKVQRRPGFEIETLEGLAPGGALGVIVGARAFTLTFVVVQTTTSRSACGYGSGARKVAQVMLKIATLGPMPSDNAKTSVPSSEI